MIALEAKEEIRHIVRKHWFILFSQTFFLVFLMLLPFGIPAFVALFDTALSSSGIAVPHISLSGLLFVFLYALWLLILWIYFFIVWTDYYLDAWYITDRRIIDVEQKGFFSRIVSSISYDRIQDITVETHGFLATYFSFGDLHVQSAGESREFVIRGIDHPDRVKEIIHGERERVVDRLYSGKVSEV